MATSALFSLVSGLISWPSLSRKTSICPICRALDLRGAVQRARKVPYPKNKHGIILAKLPGRPDPQSYCRACQLLSEVTLEIPENNGDLDVEYEIRVFPYLATELLGKRSSTCHSGLDGTTDSSSILVVLPIDFNLWDSDSRRQLDALMSERGYLMCWDNSILDNYQLLPRPISPRFDARLVSRWLECCNLYHGACSRSPRSISNLRLIDCHTSDIISFDGNHFKTPPPYVSLSYVWGQPKQKTANKRQGPPIFKLPSALPRVVEDAIEVTIALGLRYLWVDKYCIDQHDPRKQHEQIHQMDLVYKNSELTIIAAGATGEDWRLPGVMFRREWALMNGGHPGFADIGTMSLSRLPPCPIDAIKESHWATRGWTYQEAFLSRRRLVFTSDQLYFECNSMHCCESLAVNFDAVYAGKNRLLREFIQPREFGMAQFDGSYAGGDTRTQNLLRYMTCVEQYSKRDLSFSRDSLNAFVGIANQFESLSESPVRHIWGIPFFSQSDARNDNEYVNADQSFLAGLCWIHPFKSGRHQRRPDFPSWSWAGWAGGVIWPEDWKSDWTSWPGNIGFRAAARNVHAIIEDKAEELADRGMAIRIDSLNYFSRSARDRDIHYPSRISFDSQSIPSDAYSYSDETARLIVWGCEVAVAMSPRIKTADVFNHLVSGYYVAIELGSSGPNAYFLMARVQQNAYHRVGLIIMSVFQRRSTGSPLFVGLEGEVSQNFVFQ